MTFYIRDGETNIAEVSLWVDGDYVEISSHTYLKAYSDLLCDLDLDQKELASAFVGISELRGWLYEEYKKFKKEDYFDIEAIIKRKIRLLCSRFGLRMVED